MGDRGPWRVLVVLLMAGALLLGACSSDDDGGDSSPEGGTSENAGAPSDMDPNGILKLGYDINQSGNAWNYNALDIAQGNTMSNDALWYFQYARLMRPVAGGEIEPDLATSVEIVDVNTIEVTLREGLVFSDGSPLDADAVKASYEALLAAKADNEDGFSAGFYSLDSIEVTSPTTLTFGFSDGTAPSWFDQYVSTPGGTIFKFGGDPNVPIGAGPFMVTNYTTGVSWTFAKNPTYWNADAIKFAGIEITQVNFDQTQAGLAALRAGQVDIVFSEPSMIDAFTGNLEPVTKTSPNSAAMMMICKREGPLADARVRQALNKGMDREAISEAVYYGTAEPMTEPWPEGHRLFNPDVADVLAYDPEGAEQLLADAGYADGFSVDVYPIQAFNLDEAAVVIKQQWAEIGVTANIVPTTDYVNQFMNTGKPGIGIYPSAVPGPQKLNVWTGPSLGNVCQYENPEIAKIAESLTGYSEQSEEAVDLWHQLDEEVTTEAPSGFIVFTADVGGYNTDRIGDMEMWPLGNYAVPDPWVSYIKK